MKYYVKRFALKGLFVCGLGPVVLAIVYAILARLGVVEVITVGRFVSAVISVTILAFVAGGISMVYEIERLPLVLAMLIHATVLYIDYIVIYLMNGWLGKEITPLLVFTSCFAVGFAVIWITVYCVTKKSTEEINDKLVAIQESDGINR